MFKIKISTTKILISVLFLFQEPLPLERTPRSYGRQQLPRDLNVAASLVLECDTDLLSDAQMKSQHEAKLEFKQAQDKINEMIKNQTVIEL